MTSQRVRAGLGCALALCVGAPLAADAPPGVSRFELPASGLELSRTARIGAFFDVVGRRSAVFGYEDRPLEAWVYPLKVLDDFRLSFRLEGYPLDIDAHGIVASVVVRPEATILIYSHPAFTVRHVILAPIDEPGVAMLLDIDSTLPMTVTGSFRPRLRLMWPAGLMTPNLEWDEKARVYLLTEETRRFVGIVGSPLARDVSVMPYQEEPRDVPARFLIDVPLEAMRTSFVPIVVAAGTDGREAARSAYDRILASIPALYAANVAHYRELQERTTGIQTPDERLNTAFAWAKVGIDKGVASTPQLGTGLVAGFRTSGESERPGFAWLFGRDALWTALALDSYGEFATTRVALELLRKYQRADGKVPHEISQSASLIPWFSDYPYPWNSADATPLYVIAHADHWRATGDRRFLEQAWDSIVRAWRFTAATDKDGNGLVENTAFGHGWVEGGALYPPHEEIYMQGVWIEACRGFAEMAEVLGDGDLPTTARDAAERTRAATEKTYWLADRGFYGYATQLPREKAAEAEPGPNRARRQARLDALRTARFYDEDTVLPAVPLWWRTLDPERAESAIDHLGAGALATDWGTRLLSSRSPLYDPLSYHYGSVWPLFSGWASMGAYRYGRPHVGYQALMASALLTFEGALGYVTELLSGDYDAPFSRSSHHQVWSQAMVATPLVRGLLGVEVEGGGRVLRFAPQLPATWPRAAITNVAVGEARYDLSVERASARLTVTIARRDRSSSTGASRIVVAPAFPLDARVRSVTVDGQGRRFASTATGDVSRAELVLDEPPGNATVAFELDEGTEVHAEPEPLVRGAASRGLRVLRVRPGARELRLTLEGRGGQDYGVLLKTPRRPGRPPDGVSVAARGAGQWDVRVGFDGPSDDYVRREVTIPLEARR